MKRIFLVLFLLLVTSVFAENRVNVQVCFRKAVWQCSDGTEEITDLNMGGGNTYEHTCKNGGWTNTFKEFNDCLRFTPEEYEKVKQEDIDKLKQERVDKWLYDIKHLAPFIELTPEELQQEIDSKQQEIDSLISRKIDAQTKIDAKIIDE